MFAHDRRDPWESSASGAVGPRPGADGAAALLRLLGMLIAERVDVDLAPLYGEAKPVAEVSSDERTIAIPIGGEPFVVPLASGGRKPSDSASSQRQHAESGGLRPPLASLLAESVATREADGQAHAAFLRYTDSVRRTVIDNIAFQTSLLESLLSSSPLPGVPGRGVGGEGQGFGKQIPSPPAPLPGVPGRGERQAPVLDRVNAWSSPSVPSAAFSVLTSPPSTPTRRASVCPMNR